MICCADDHSHSRNSNQAYDSLAADVGGLFVEVCRPAVPLFSNLAAIGRGIAGCFAWTADRARVAGSVVRDATVSLRAKNDAAGIPSTETFNAAIDAAFNALRPTPPADE